MSEQEFIQFHGENVRIILKNGNIVKGFCCTFTRSNDSDSNIPSLSIETDNGLIEVLLTEVDKIKTITP